MCHVQACVVMSYLLVFVKTFIFVIAFSKLEEDCWQKKTRVTNYLQGELIVIVEIQTENDMQDTFGLNYFNDLLYNRNQYIDIFCPLLAVFGQHKGSYM